MKIYVDELVVLNLMIDYLLLSATVRIVRTPCRGWRLFLGALFGAFCSLLIFLPRLPLVLSLLIKLGSAAVMVLIVFPWHGWKALGKQVLVLFIVSAVFAGLSSALWFFVAPKGFTVANGIVYYDVSPVILTLLTVICYAAMRLYDRLTRKRAPAGCRYRLMVETEAGTAALTALLDTGLHVTETFSGKPVIIAEFDALAGALTAVQRASVADFLRDPGGNAQAVAGLKLRLVPYRTMAGAGLLPAFCPKRITAVGARGKMQDLSGAYVALTEHIGRGEYQALFGSDLTEGFAVQPHDGTRCARG